MNDNSELLEIAWTQMTGKEVLAVALSPTRGNGLQEESPAGNRHQTPVVGPRPLLSTLPTVSLNPSSLTLAGKTTAFPLFLFLFSSEQSLEQESSEAMARCV